MKRRIRKKKKKTKGSGNCKYLSNILEVNEGERVEQTADRRTNGCLDWQLMIILIKGS